MARDERYGPLCTPPWRLSLCSSDCVYMLCDRFTCVRGRVQGPTESRGGYVRARHDCARRTVCALKGYALLQGLFARIMRSSSMLSTGDAVASTSWRSMSGTFEHDVRHPNRSTSRPFEQCFFYFFIFLSLNGHDECVLVNAYVGEMSEARPHVRNNTTCVYILAFFVKSSYRGVGGLARPKIHLPYHLLRFLTFYFILSQCGFRKHCAASW